jgi:hypothetical protein
MLHHLFLHRLYYVLPDEPSAVRLVTDLESWDISPFHIHAIAGHGERLKSLPAATAQQRHDAAAKLEQALWYGNLILFAVAALGLIVALSAGASVWALAAAVAMIVTVLAGVEFVLRIPHTHLDEFRSALAHREILLMVDVPKSRKAEIEKLIEHCHPAAVAGGVGWAVEGLKI